MESMKISELKSEAKRLGLRRYSRLSTAELIDLLRNQKQIIDESVPDIDSLIIKPTEYNEKYMMKNIFHSVKLLKEIYI